MKLKNFLLVLMFVQINLYVYSQGVNQYGQITTGMQTLNQSQRDVLVSPSAGLMIWCSNCGVRGELQVYDGVGWINATGGPASNKPPVIGDTYQGGIVFDTYIDGSGVTHGLIASTADLAKAYWGDRQTAASAYTGGGYTDWRLPTTSEFVKLFNKRNLSGLAGTFQTAQASVYWPDNNLRAGNDPDATGFSFYSGGVLTASKSYTNSIRPIRSF